MQDPGDLYLNMADLEDILDKPTDQPEKESESDLTLTLTRSVTPVTFAAGEMFDRSFTVPDSIFEDETAESAGPPVLPSRTSSPSTLSRGGATRGKSRSPGRRSISPGGNRSGSGSPGSAGSPSVPPKPTVDHIFPDGKPAPPPKPWKNR